MIPPRRIPAIVIVVALALVALSYGVDDLVLRYRLHSAAGLEPVTVYPATYLKNGKLEIFWTQGQTEYCARSLFPHGRHNPCWYVKRHTPKVI